MYKFQNQHSINRLADGINFPVANGNSDYEECKRWIALDPIKNVVQAADPPTPPTAKEQKNVADLLTAKANTQLVALTGMDATQIVNYINTKSTIDPETKKIFILLGIGLSIALRDKLE